MNPIHCKFILWCQNLHTDIIFRVYIPIYVVFAGWLWSRQNTCFFIAGLLAWLVWNQCYTWLGIASVDHVVPTAHFLHFILLNAPVIDPSKVFTLAQLKAWSWVTSKTVSASFTYSEWCIDPKACMFSIKWAFIRVTRLGYLYIVQ